MRPLQQKLILALPTIPNLKEIAKYVMINIKSYKLLYIYMNTKYIIQYTVCKKNNVNVKSTHFLDLSTITDNRLALLFNRII